MKNILKSIFDKLGYRIQRKESVIPKDLRGQVRNPFFANYYARKHQFLINADFKKCIILRRFSCEKTGNNPLVNTVTDYIENGHISYSGSKLEDFYNTCTPQNVAALYNLEGKLHDDLVQLSATSFVSPWENANMESKKEFRERHIKIVSKSRGKELSLDHGWGTIGPISKERGMLEVKTLVELTKSINDKGYIRGNGSAEDIQATTLVDGSDYKYVVLNGSHRISVLSALDYKFAPVRVLPTCIPAFIYRREVDYWPNVKNELYTRDQALKIFDSIFKGDGSYK
jgi:hypothetical protein